MHWAAGFDTQRGLYVVADQAYNVYAYASASDTWERIGTQDDGAASLRRGTDTGLVYCPNRDGVIYSGREMGTAFFCMASRKWRRLNDSGGTRPALSSGGGHVLRLTVGMPGTRRRFSRLSADSVEWEELGASGTTIPQSGIELPPVGDLNPGNIMAYDSKRNRFVVFFRSEGQGHTWAYDPKVSRWSELNPVAQPPPRGRPSLCYDAGNDLIVMHGGSGVADTWVFDAERNSWFELVVAHDDAIGAVGGIEYDARSRLVIAFRGRSANRLAAVWTLTIEPR